jgi:hypothetical protein
MPSPCPMIHTNLEERGGKKRDEKREMKFFI